MSSKPLKLSGYTYLRNAVEMEYPAAESISSHLAVCDEVVVVNASPDDQGTRDLLSTLTRQVGGDRLKVVDVDVDWAAPNHGLFDGQLKGMAREEATGDWLIQFDSDEFIPPEDGKKLRNTLSEYDEAQDARKPPVLALPVVEYWGSENRVRVDVNPWKWRASKNDPNITHGVPVTHRVMKDGLLFAKPGTDGCDMIWRDSGQPVPTLHFVTSDVEQVRLAAFSSEGAAANYENWVNMVTHSLPTWFHFSWWSVERKIRQYQAFWTEFWKSMYGPDQVPETNPFFPGRDLKTVSPQEVHDLAVMLEVNTGGWVFHQPWDSKRRCHIYLERQVPSAMRAWCDAHKTNLGG